jgi:hypothetical protein
MAQMLKGGLSKLGGAAQKLGGAARVRLARPGGLDCVGQRLACWVRRAACGTGCVSQRATYRSTQTHGGRPEQRARGHCMP